MGFGTRSLRAFDFPQNSPLIALSHQNRTNETKVNGSLASNLGWQWLLYEMQADNWKRRLEFANWYKRWRDEVGVI